MQLDLETFLSKTSPAGSTCPTTPSAVSWERLSEQMMPCVRHSTASGPVQVWLPGQGHGLHGGFSTLNISEWPNDAAVCSLSQILEKGPIPQRFFLSAKACRSEERRVGKEGVSKCRSGGWPEH